MYWLEIVHSPDDGGYYVTVVIQDGSEIYTTPIYQAESEAREDAQNWIEGYHSKKYPGWSPIIDILPEPI